MELDTFTEMRWSFIFYSFCVLEKGKITTLRIRLGDSLMSSTLLAITQRSLQGALFVSVKTLKYRTL